MRVDAASRGDRAPAPPPRRRCGRGALLPPGAPHGRPHGEPHTAARRRAGVWERGLENTTRVRQLPSAAPPKASRNRPPRATQDTRRNTSSRRPWGGRKAQVNGRRSPKAPARAEAPIAPLTPGVAAERVAPPGSGRLGVGPRLTPPSGIVPGQVAWLSCRLSSGKGEVPTPPAAQLWDELHAAGEVFAEMTATVIITGKDRRKTETIRNHEIRTGRVLTQQNHGTHGTWGPVSTLGRRRGAPSHAACLYKPF